jgi:hypothetical protein
MTLLTRTSPKFRQNPSGTSRLEMCGRPEKGQYLTTQYFSSLYYRLLKKTAYKKLLLHTIPEVDRTAIKLPEIFL